MPQETGLKAQMMAAAEEAIDELVRKTEAKEHLTLSEIEELVRTAGEAVMTRLTGQLVEAEAQEDESANCPECGEPMRYKGKRGRNLITETGEVRVERAYYYCPACRRGVFPPGPTMGDD